MKYFRKFSASQTSCFTVLSLILAFSYPVDGDGTFQSYNSKERKRFEASSISNIRHLNEIEDDTEEVKVSTARNNFHTTKSGPYFPNWPSLDSRLLPKWYDESKIGIFIHWGVFSALGFNGAWFWECWREGHKDCVDFAKKNFKPNFTYQEIAPEFTAEFFNSSDWADLFRRSGARYVVLTTKHHEGFTLWPSKTAFGWNANDVGPHRDLVGELSRAIRNHSSLRFGVYHSLYEWYNPLYLDDKQNNFKTNQFVRFKTMPELYELVETYQPDVVWSDGDWEAPDTYWNSTEFLAWLYNDSPVKETVVTNDRWGLGTMCKHGGFNTCADRYNPGVLQPKKWENCMTLDKYAWSFRKNTNFEDYLTPEELITTIERLLQMGEWLGLHGEAIYSTVPWTFQNDTATANVWYTANPHMSRVYAIMTKWPENCERTIILGAVDGKRVSVVTMLGGYKDHLKFEDLGDKSGVRVELPAPDEIKSKWAWVIVLQMV
ncbi:Alpha-L-fucosidase [Folsomia candida]|uniref:Putative alpha-L-fucosidase n=1 Tax=Folsomia candida TaxID=158441 RepID=A0A226E2C8_FOLCA|nr:Alpha-L-fucosidase [Folsomia candida]